MARKSSPRTAARRRAPTRRQRMERLQRRLLLALGIIIAVIGLMVWVGGQQSQAGLWLEDWLTRLEATSMMRDRHIGIVVGHKDHDSGAVCENGVTEGSTVARIADQTANQLRAMGATVDLLAEYDERLNGYEGDALVSIHADSCIDRSGFKVARSETSVIPEIEDRLVDCLRQRYGEATGLSFDPVTITPDMTQYHAFKRVANGTPGAIVEIGFLGGDAGIIIDQPDMPARGIVNGVVCFFELALD